MSGVLNILRSSMFRFPNVSRLREALRFLSRRRHARPAPSGRHWIVWPLPLSARVPIVSGGLILAVALLASRVMMATVAREQETRSAAASRRCTSTASPPRSIRTSSHATWTNTIEVAASDHVVPPGHERAAGHGAAAGWQPVRRCVRVCPCVRAARRRSGDDPFHDASAAAAAWNDNDGFVFDSKTGTGWASRAIVRDGNHVADLYVALELKPLIAERQAASPESAGCNDIGRIGCCRTRIP